MIIRIILFLIFNFLALAIGGFFTSDGVSSEWYQTLHKAPWTPPGWFFGFAWTTIMILFSVFMAKVSMSLSKLSSWMPLYVLQWILNVVWNPIFFYFHLTGLGLFTIILLTMVVGMFFWKYQKDVNQWRWLVSPYLLWLIVATSLNGYAFWMN